MKNIFIALLFSPMVTIGQVQVYDPSGKLLCAEHCIPNQINKMVGINYAHLHSPTYGSDMVAFKMLTKTPVWVATSSPKNIPKLLKSFSYSEYLDGEMEIELDRMIRENALTDIYTFNAFGKPSNKFATSDGSTKVESWEYEKLKLTIYFKNSIAFRYSRFQ
jgi:hypothetical protein